MLLTRRSRVATRSSSPVWLAGAVVAAVLGVFGSGSFFAVVVPVAGTDVISCAAGIPPCSETACSPSCGSSAGESGKGWSCVTVPPGWHAPEDELGLVLHGLKGLEDLDELAYRVVFHNSTLNYPCEHVGKQEKFCSNQNKLFGFSRGFTPVMSRSCMFSWRSTYLPDEPKNKLKVWAYGWLNEDTKPWTHPKQNPPMGYYDINTPYLFHVRGFANHCEYTIADARTGKQLAAASTPMEAKIPGPSYFFALYFGGTETTSVPVTVSYSRDLNCTK